MNKILKFQHGGTWYKVNSKGYLTQENNDFTHDWKLLGVSLHHWRNSIDLSLSDLFKNPKKMVNGIVWDVDHGTTRRWGGRYFGKIPRVESAYIDKEK